MKTATINIDGQIVEIDYTAEQTLLCSNGETLFEGRKFASEEDAQRYLSSAYADASWQLDMES